MSDERLSAVQLELEATIEELNQEKEISAVEVRHADSTAEENYALGYQAAHESTLEKLEALLRAVA